MDSGVSDAGRLGKTAAQTGAQTAQGRGMFAAIGGGAGLATWLLVEQLGAVIANERAYLFIVACAGVFFASLLAMIGPLRLRAALLRAAGLAVLVAGLLLWASFRFDGLEGYFRSPYPVLAALGLAVIAVQFLIAAGLPAGWRDYPTLFSQSWSIVVRYGAAWVFVGIVWALVMLSGALLELVGVDLIRRLLDMDAVPYLLTGLALGLALAVVEELSEYVSPFLVLRLLRLLLPAVVIVVAVFLLALPFRGLSQLFGGLSAAFIWLAMAVGAVTLVTTALDQRDGEAVTAPVMLWSARALSLMIPVLAWLGAWAVGLRVAQYGWTPDRLAAALAAVVVLGYGVLYALAVFWRGAWMRRVRDANIAMALVIMGLCALWLTPALNAERLSAQSQVARFVDGKTAAEGLDLWQMRDDLGRAGVAGLAQLRVLAVEPGQEALAVRLAALDRGDYEAVLPDPEALAASLADLTAVLPVRPVGNEGILDEIVKAAYPGEVAEWIASCALVTPAGKPGCVLVVGDFLLQRAGPEAILFRRYSSDYFGYDAFSLGADGVMARPATSLIGGEPVLEADADAMLELLDAGQFSVVPAEINALSVGGRQIMINP